MPPGATPDAAFANRHDVLTAQIPSFGTMSARAAARVYAALLGHVAGTRLLSAEQLAAAAASPTPGETKAIARLDDIVANAYPPPANPEDRNP